MEAKILTIAIVTSSSIMLKPRVYRISLIFPVCTVIAIVPQSRSGVQINARFRRSLTSFDVRGLWHPRTPIGLESLCSSTAFNLQTDRALGAFCESAESAQGGSTKHVHAATKTNDSRRQPLMKAFCRRSFGPSIDHSFAGKLQR